MTEIFVFGSNLAGRHGKGAALDAVKKHGAIYGQGHGLQGSSYAIPTKSYFMYQLPLYEIQEFVATFLAFADENPDLTFNITKVGSGLAGYDWETQIRPFFPDPLPKNCRFI